MTYYQWLMTLQLAMLHLMLALSASLQQDKLGTSAQSFTDASLQAFAFMPTLVKARHQVWLVQSPLTEACSRALRSVPVEPGEWFGPAASQVLEWTVQARQTRRQFAGLHRRRPIPGLDVQQLPLRAAFCHRLLATKGFSVLLRGWPGTFGPLIVFPLDNPGPQRVTDTPHWSLLRLGDQKLWPWAGSCFTQQPLSHWAVRLPGQGCR